ncbi:hypothetical protein PILCRDRAFT_439774 [Piloderma croceum F 1598]|uniref:Mitochondrial distribution and morphology protein family 31/32 n=1 Tax=Piloderma croceum (strain F 1598) TaxID=765440 RepID=A0A0C3C149_PILCF|nr:hypothetical protein PILCRDRAFT_439774 [Piloderma croceum F 1598]
MSLKLARSALPAIRPSSTRYHHGPISKCRFFNSRVRDTTALGLGSRWASFSTVPPGARFHSCARSESGSSSPRTDDHTTDKQPPHPPPSPSHYENYPPFLKRLALSLPQNQNQHPHLHPHPTLDDFLKTTSSFWQRARIRFKWFTIKSFRKFNADDISAFVTWFLGAQVLWVLVGTTTFFSVVFATANSLRLQEYLAHAISDYLTSETGVTIIFESAIVPKWKDSRISFKNVYISRRPASSSPSFSSSGDGGARNGSGSGSGGVGHKAAIGYDVSSHPAYNGTGDDDEDGLGGTGVKKREEEEEDTNYSYFDLNVDSIDVTLSLWRWLDGKGLVADAVVKGVRGVVDRRAVHWDPTSPLSPLSFRHSPSQTQNTFHLTSLTLSDVLLTIHQPPPPPPSHISPNPPTNTNPNPHPPPKPFRPYTFSIFHASFTQVRRDWLFYDLLSTAEGVVGQFDGCLFSLHRPQSVGRTMGQEVGGGEFGRMSRIRIDGVNIDHLQSLTTLQGPISWITSGKVDVVFDIKFPTDPAGSDVPLNVILGEIADAISAAAAASTSSGLGSSEDRIPGQRELAKPPLTAPPGVTSTTTPLTLTPTTTTADDGEDDMKDKKKKEEDEPKVIIDIDLRFRDLKAAVPIFTNDLSYVNMALIRPIVYFMNANRTLVPIRCRVVKNLSDFEGAWTMWETALMDEISLKTYDALAYHVTQANMNRRVKAVGVWSLQMTASAVLSAMRSMMDPVKAVYANGLPYYDAILPAF